jgi:hypothetical protein
MTFSATTTFVIIGKGLQTRVGRDMGNISRGSATARSRTRIVNANRGNPGNAACVDVAGAQEMAWWNRREVAAFLRLSEATLRIWACQRKGPKFIKHGTGRGAYVRYARHEVLEYALDPVGYEAAKHCPHRRQKSR